MFKNLVIGFLVAILLIVAWNPIIAPAGRAVGRFVSGGIAALNGQAAPVASATPAAAPVASATPAAVTTAGTTTSVADPEVADGPVEEEELGRSVWNGTSFDWDNVPAEIADNQFLVAHGDLQAKGESAIAVFTTAKAARTYLRHGTWAMVLVTVPDGETINEYLEALNERLGSGYSLVLKP